MQNQSQSFRDDEDDVSFLSYAAPGHVLRFAEEADLPEIARLVAASWRQAYRHILPPTALDRYTEPAFREKRMREAWERGDRILVETDAEGVILGTVGERVPCRLAGFDAEVDRLYVLPGAVGGGIGYRLMMTLSKVFLKDGCRSMAVHTFQENSGGRGFYERLGGQYHSTDIWESYPCVWYTWDETGMRLLLRDTS